MKVQALYDFHAEPGSAEIDIVTGEILTVTRKDVGEGWWEGTNQSGQTGLFPAAYVEEFKPIPIVSKPPGVPPPPLPTDWSGTTESNSQYMNTNSVSQVGNENSQYMNSNQSASYEPVDPYWDDEWDDDSESGAAPPAPPPLHSLPQLPSMSDTTSMGGVSGTVGKRNINRFSSFVKSNWESYILGTVSIPIQKTDRIFIEEYEDGVKWASNPEPYGCMVASPKKETKLKGLKSYIAYQLTPTFSNIQVQRRYKHFDWLHLRLEEKYSLIPIPPLPDKQISGRYEEQFIEHRKNQLQSFVDYVCRHPVLSQSPVWTHFITCTDEKRWKQGKRTAEKDNLLGPNLFFAIDTPERSISHFNLEQETESCSRFIHGVDSAVKIMVAVVADQTKKCQSLYKREYQKIGQVIYALGQAIGMEEQTGIDRSQLRDALKKTGDTYNELGKLFEEQPKLDWEPLGDVLHIYKGIITSMPDILTMHKDILNKKREYERMTTENKMDANHLQEVLKRTDTVSYALLGEINHFHTEQVSQLNAAMKSFLTEQIGFYQKFVGQLQTALESYD
uniref:Sorting nexin-33 n=2 Tax=Cacopsylla melanoneura TaxID=428564 RepID=A0A8D8WFW6_9HEMI